MESITNGSHNTASGAEAMPGLLSGSDNTADGYGALGNSIGGGNTAVGSLAFAGYEYSGHPQNNNTAIGAQTLAFLETGDNNTALGWKSLYTLTNGGHNIAVGYEAGQNILTGDNNIEIGNGGTTTDSGVIHIGAEGTQTTTVIAGIYGEAISGATAATVYIDDTGHLGTVFVTGRPQPAISGGRNVTAGFEPADAKSVLAAIQGLNQKVDSENAQLKDELKRRDAENAQLKERLEALEKIILSQQ
jgi:hypothetical protein